MHEFPATPAVEDASADVLEGHLWLTEVVEGLPLRFQVRDSGLVRFGDETRGYDDPEAVPLGLRPAARHVRERLDRDALRAAVADVEAVTFLGVATVRRSIDYDWARLPPFLGVDVWSASAGSDGAGTAGGFHPPDAAAGIFERLGLEPANAVARELPARDFDPDSHAIPGSAWYDGPAAGVLVRNKRGGRAVLEHPDVGAGAGSIEAEDAAALAARIATAERFQRLAAALEDRGRAVTAEALAERAFEAVVREGYPALDRGAVEPAAVRSEVAALARAFLADRPGDAW